MSDEQKLQTGNCLIPNNSKLWYVREIYKWNNLSLDQQRLETNNTGMFASTVKSALRLANLMNFYNTHR